jgi:DNA polymerase III alpha subunit (gram-positive type)
MKFYFLDIETNSESLEFNKNDHEIIQIWIYNSDTKEKFTRNINIWKPLSENIKRLTWISDDDLISWIDLKTALNDAITFLWDVKDSVIVWHNLEDFDLYILWKNYLEVLINMLLSLIKH